MAETIGERIKKKRLELNMTLAELGAQVGAGASTVRKWEIGFIKDMKSDKIKKVAAVLGVTPAFLMGWKIDGEVNDNNNHHDAQQDNSQDKTSQKDTTTQYKSEWDINTNSNETQSKNDMKKKPMVQTLTNDNIGLLSKEELAIIGVYRVLDVQERLRLVKIAIDYMNAMTFE
jgi:transcriptional regulator with XRE-family HTH domain